MLTHVHEASRMGKARGWHRARSDSKEAHEASEDGSCSAPLFSADAPLLAASTHVCSRADRLTTGLRHLLNVVLSCCSVWTAGRADAEADVLSQRPLLTEVMGRRAEATECCRLRPRRSALPVHGLAPRKGCASRSMTRLYQCWHKAVVCDQSVIVVLMVRCSPL